MMNIKIFEGQYPPPPQLFFYTMCHSVPTQLIPINDSEYNLNIM